MVAVGFERILPFSRIALPAHFLRRDELRNRMNFLSFLFGERPGLRNFSEPLGIDFNLAARRRQRIRFRILAEGLEHDAVVVAHAVLHDAFGPELLKAREFRAVGNAAGFLERLFVAPAEPFLVGAPFGIGVLNAEARRHFAHDLPVRPLLPENVGGLRAGDEIVVVADRVGIRLKVVDFLIHGVRQQIVGEFGARRHLIVDDDNRLHERLVLENRTKLIDAAVLVDERVALRVPDELDVVLEMLDAAHGRILRRHRLRIRDGLGP